MSKVIPQGRKGRRGRFSAVKSPVPQLFTLGLIGVCLLGMLLSLLQYLGEDPQMPSGVYLVFGLVQLVAVGLQIRRRNLLTSVFGFGLTAVLLIAVVIENTKDPKFDSVLTISAYTPHLIRTAYHVLLFSTCLFHAITIRFAPRQVWMWQPATAAEQQLARYSVWIFLILGIIATLLTVRGSSITEAPYASIEFSAGSGPVESGGLELLSTYFLVFTLVAAARGRGLLSLHYKTVLALVVVTVVYFRGFRGDRGASLIIYSTIAVIFYFSSLRPNWQKNAFLALGSIGMYFFYELWGDVRGNAATEGFWNALAVGWQRAVVEKFWGSSTTNGFDALQITLLPQSYWHLLHTIDLYSSGISLNGSSFVDLIPQSIPEFISNAMDYERPLNGAWRLAEYRIHGGGMFVVAEGYWNFGLFGAALVTGGLALLAVKLEWWYRRQEPFLACTYFAFLGTFGIGMFYGLQSLVKAFEIAFTLALVFKFLMGIHRNRFLSQPTRTAPPLTGTTQARLPEEAVAASQ